jgi:hypothetical protein
VIDVYAQPNREKIKFYRTASHITFPAKGGLPKILHLVCDFGFGIAAQPGAGIQTTVTVCAPFRGQARCVNRVTAPPPLFDPIGFHDQSVEPGSVIAVENLTDIRSRTKQSGRKQGRRHHSWSYARLRGFLTDKTRRNKRAAR